MPRSAHKEPKLVGNYKHRVVVECLVDSTTAMLWGSVTLTALLSSTGRIVNGRFACRFYYESVWIS